MRLCTVQGRKALFHCWEQVSKVEPPSPLREGPQGGTIRYTVGIVEYQDGSVERVIPDDIVFSDSGKLMQRTERELNRWEARQNAD